MITKHTELFEEDSVTVCGRTAGEVHTKKNKMKD